LAKKKPARRVRAPQPLVKARTGIAGLDEITMGGLPKGRATLVAGGAGSGKTLFGVAFLVRGALDFDEPGVLVTFEETATDIAENVRSLGIDIERLVARGRLVIDHVRIERSEIHETGEYDLEGLFVRLDHAVRAVGARRVVIDTLEVLFAGLSDAAILRAELRRLFGWLKDRRLTTIITAERGTSEHPDALTRHGLEEYVSDCVILLDHRAADQVTTRRMRILKYRGSTHGTNEYPFLIDNTGISVLPVTSLGLSHSSSNERVSSGTPGLDMMLTGKGFFRGSSVLVSGTAGSGKTSLAATFIDAACRRRERALYFAFEESPDQIIRNMRSIGLDLQPWVASGRLEFHASRPTLYGLEMHLAMLHRTVRDFRPAAVVIDPVTNLHAIGNSYEVKAMLTRLIDFLKSESVTAMFTSLNDDVSQEKTDVGVSSLMDTWILLRNIESDGERNRGLYVLKSRGMAHSNQIREFTLSSKGIALTPAYIGAGGVLTGTARTTQEARERAEVVRRADERQRVGRVLAERRRHLESQIEQLRANFAAEVEDLESNILESNRREQALEADTDARARARGAAITGRR
jgi:circadian clock protein KaiC